MSIDILQYALYKYLLPCLLEYHINKSIYHHFLILIQLQIRNQQHEQHYKNQEETVRFTKNEVGSVLTLFCFQHQITLHYLFHHLQLIIYHHDGNYLQIIYTIEFYQNKQYQGIQKSFSLYDEFLQRIKQRYMLKQTTMITLYQKQQQNDKEQLDKRKYDLQVHSTISNIKMRTIQVSLLLYFERISNMYLQMKTIIQKQTFLS